MYTNKTKQIYVRKPFPHDMTHEVSVTTEIVEDFFENKTSMVFYKTGDSLTQHIVTINSATDPRFGGKFASLWSSDNLQVGDFIIIKKLGNNSYELSTIKKGNINFDFLTSIFADSSIQRHAVISQSLFNNTTNNSNNQPLQQIFYGAPGTGKSHKVKEVTETLPKSDVFRTTFHPDSDYSTFVGCYKPKMVKAPIRDGSGHEITSACEDEKKRIAYEYEPQAFLKAYVRAYETSEPVFLVIEEINRGNCAQIFGDMFQLLDRNENGESDYAIKPETAIQEFLNEKLEDCDIADEAIKSGEEMRLPANLHIWATMNTSDQSLFPIDSAFKRRWDWKYMPINTRKESWSIKVNGTEYSWSSFLEKINEEIGSITNSEDKKLGFYFCKAENGVISAERFVSKVLFYIYNDVFKDNGFDKDIFNDTDGKLSFGKFYQENGDIQEDKVALFLKNLGVGSAGATEDETDIEYDTTDAGKAEHKETLVAVTINGERLTADGMTQFDLYLNTIKKIGVDKVGPVLETMKYRRKGSPMATKDQVQSLLESDGYSYVEADGYYFVKGSNGYTLIRVLEDLNKALQLNIMIEFR